MATKDLVPIGDYRVMKLEGSIVEAMTDVLGGEPLSARDLKRVVMPGSGGVNWTIGDDTAKTIQGVIMKSWFTRQYWQEKYSGASDPPDCKSDDAKLAIPIGKGPGVPVERDENTGMLKCSTCPNAQFGSAVNDKGEKTRGQACSLNQMLAVLQPNKKLPIVIKLAPTSLASARQYFLDLDNDDDLRYHQVITDIGLERRERPGVPPHAVATFRKVDVIAPEAYERLKEYAAFLAPAFESFTQAETSGEEPNGDNLEPV